jgi:co-chaperonin GroES (HSP10)
MMKVQPVGEMILVEIFKTEDKSAGGIFLAGTENPNDYSRAVVLAVGESDLIKVKVGYVVILPKKVNKMTITREEEGKNGEFLIPYSAVYGYEVA